MKGEGRMLNGIWMAMIVLAFVGAVCTAVSYTHLTLPTTPYV